MKKKALKAALAFFICWVFFVALEGLLLIGSTDPGKAPLIVLGAHILLMKLMLSSANGRRMLLSMILNILVMVRSSW